MIVNTGEEKSRRVKLGMVTCAILASMQELQHAARIANRSNVLENVDL